MTFAGGTVAGIAYLMRPPTRTGPMGHDYAGSLQIAANVSAVVGNVIAHSDNNSVGCRMVVNGQVEAERISNDVNAYTQCTVKGA
jgi:hypothetical protein